MEYTKQLGPHLLKVLGKVCMDIHSIFDIVKLFNLSSDNCISIINVYLKIVLGGAGYPPQGRGELGTLRKVNSNEYVDQLFKAVFNNEESELFQSSGTISKRAGNSNVPRAPGRVSS